jgi:hypothetical protein
MLTRMRQRGPGYSHEAARKRPLLCSGMGLRRCTANDCCMAGKQYGQEIRYKVEL